MKNNHEIPVIVGHEGILDGQRWMLRETMTLGRDANCEIHIPNRQVSRQHARITLTERGVTIEDLNSKNGLHCNGKRITEAILLSDGDIIHIALAQKFIFFSSDATLPLELDTPLDITTHHQERLLLNKRSRRVWIGKEEIIPPLSASQYHLLEILFDNKGCVVPRDKLMNGIWGEEGAIAVSGQALDALVRRLRNRIAKLDPDHEYIITVRGHGLRLDNLLENGSD
ncbi:MAG: FHA domain-containing protein [Chloroflexota bacterium]|nr:FHA domain-containing protein [Chloroflexota bacterium]